MSGIIFGYPVFLILCGVFYGVLCIFSLVTGLIYAAGKRELNPLELSDRTVSRLDTPEKKDRFARKMGWVTFVVGIVQGMTAACILTGFSPVGTWFAIGFTVFSILSVLFKLKSRISSFALTKAVFYVAILVVLVLSLSGRMGFVSLSQLEHALGQEVRVDQPLVFETELEPDLDRITSFMEEREEISGDLPDGELTLDSVRIVYDFAGNPYVYVEFQPYGWCIYNQQHDMFCMFSTLNTGVYGETESEDLYFGNGFFYAFEDGQYHQIPTDTILKEDRELLRLANLSVGVYR